jgi:exodeoxyribonuclease VII small subunit
MSVENKDNLEAKLKRLADIAAKLEDRNNSLDEALAMFETGVKLTAECLESINSKRGKLTLLQQEMDKLTEKPFEDFTV